MITAEQASKLYNPRLDLTIYEYEEDLPVIMGWIQRSIQERSRYQKSIEVKLEPHQLQAVQLLLEGSGFNIFVQSHSPTIILVSWDKSAS